MGMRDDWGLSLIFSLKDGDVWASRLDGGPPTMLGLHDEVVQAMNEFIKQAEFAERLFDKAARNARSGPATSAFASIPTDDARSARNAQRRS